MGFGIAVFGNASAGKGRHGCELELAAPAVEVGREMLAVAEGASNARWLELLNLPCQTLPSTTSGSGSARSRVGGAGLAVSSRSGFM